MHHGWDHSLGGADKMANLEMMSVTQQIETLFEGGSMSGLTDAQLLERFNLKRDGRGEAAFAELVNRHGPMVLNVCHQMLDDRHLAEDAFQATFFVLARKARTLTRSDWLANWLYGVALRTARCARGKLARRRKHEEVGTVGNPSTSLTAERSVPPAEEAIVSRDQARALHGEIARLPDAFRMPVVLCYLEGLTVVEAAERLAISHGTVRSRMVRAREKLRRGLERRGVVVPAATLIALLESREASACVSDSLRSLTTQAALRFAADPASVAASSASLAQQVLRSIFAHRLTQAALAVVVFGAVATSMGLVARSLNGRNGAAEPPVAIEPPAQERPQQNGTERAPGARETTVALDAPGVPNEAARPQSPDSAHRTIRFVVLGPDDKPLPNAHVFANIVSMQNRSSLQSRSITNRDYQTDATGVALVELPKGYTSARLFTSKPPLVPMYTHWDEEEFAGGKTIPDEYTVRLERGVSAGGRIVDDNGRPIAGAKVQVKIEKSVRPTRSEAQSSFGSWLAEGDDAAITDAEGHWHIENVPDHPGVELSLLVTHPDHVSDERWGDHQRVAGINTAMMLKGSAALTLKAGTIVRGRVTDPDGKPIAGAVVVFGNDPYFAKTRSEFLTDADGRFRLPASAPGRKALTVIAPGWAPQDRMVNLQPGLPEQEFRLARGKPIRLRVVDVSGKPLKAYVTIQSWNGRQALHNHEHPNVRDNKIPRRTDSAGVWEWTWAPVTSIGFKVNAVGYAGQELNLGGGEPERTIVLRAEHRITGRVTDAVTGKPIPEFRVTPIDVFRKDWLVAEPGNAKPGKDGRLNYVATRTDIPMRIRVSAMGYRTQDGPEFRIGDDGARTQDFRLQPSPPITGLVVDPAGRPAPGVVVSLATPTQEANLWFDYGNATIQTDASGRFAFPDPGGQWGIVARSEAGFAQAEFPAGGHDAGTLKLRPFAKIRGQLRDGGKPVEGATVLLHRVHLHDKARPDFGQSARATVTTTDGSFEFADVPPVPICLAVSLGPWKEEPFRSGPRVPLDLRPGQSVVLDLGGTGAVVEGKVTLEGKVPADLDCAYSLNYLIRRGEGITLPAEVASLGFDARSGWRDAWSNTEEGGAYLRTLPSWFVKLAPDGAFRISGVPPGDYDLAVSVYSKPSGCLVDPLARVVTPVTVTADDAARGGLKLPEIRATVVSIPGVGEKAPLQFTHADGHAGSVDEVRGSYTLVHFWASWCGPCKGQLPTLRRLHERFQSRGLRALGLSLDEKENAFRDAVNRLALPWPQGRLSKIAETGVSSVPAYWLIDPEGKIVGKAADLDELTKVLDERLK